MEPFPGEEPFLDRELDLSRGGGEEGGRGKAGKVVSVVNAELDQGRSRHFTNAEPKCFLMRS